MSTNNTDTISTHNGSPKPEQSERFKVAFEDLAAERDALPPNQVERINVDVAKVVNTVFAHLPQIQALAEEVKALPSFDVAGFEKIERYAMALSFAQMLHNAASTPIEYVPELATELAKIRERLMADASALATRGYLDGSRLTQLKGGPGYKNIAYDVGTLVAMMRAVWSKIAGKTAVSESELTNAQVQTEKLLVGVAAREQQEIDITAAADQRQRAFTLLVNAYDQARRAATFLRWELDIDEIVPSFYNGRGTSKKRSEEVPEPAPAPESSVPIASPPAGNGTVSTTSPGLPGSSPFAT